MKIQTMSIVVGTSACNAMCPFCVSKTTPQVELSSDPNWRNFDKACKLAQIGGATTVLLTGKGEPTLYPSLINDYLIRLNGEFPFVELQTNGIEIGQGKIDNWLKEWYDNGLTTVCLSAVHYEQNSNRFIYNDKYPHLEDMAKKLHNIGFTVRLSIMMMKGYIEDRASISKVINFCKENKIKQLTIRPLHCPDDSISKEADWARERTIKEDKLNDIKEWLDKYANPVLNLSHGATVYDFEGQNVCLANCLTTNNTTEDMRQIIYFPNGTISYDWKFSGAILL